MMKKAYITLLAASVLSVAATGIAVAGKNDCSLKHTKHHKMHMQKGHHGIHMLPPMRPMYLHHIKLTDEQEDKIFALVHAEIPKARTLKKEQHALRDSLKALTHSEAYSEKKAREIAAELASLEGEKLLSKTILDNKIYNLLTDEQKKKVDLKRHHKKHDADIAPTPHVSPAVMNHTTPANQSKNLGKTTA